MNYSKKWEQALLKEIKARRGAVQVSTRKSADINRMTRMQEEGKITLALVGSGVWECSMPTAEDAR